jgi:hypothetical protein
LGRAKTSALWVAAPFVLHPHAPGLSHSLPADNYYIGVRLDWVTQTWALASNTVGGAFRNVAVALTWDAKPYNLDSLETCVPIDPV